MISLRTSCVPTAPKVPGKHPAAGGAAWTFDTRTLAEEAGRRHTTGRCNTDWLQHVTLKHGWPGTCKVTRGRTGERTCTPSPSGTASRAPAAGSRAGAARPRRAAAAYPARGPGPSRRRRADHRMTRARNPCRTTAAGPESSASARLPGRRLCISPTRRSSQTEAWRPEAKKQGAAMIVIFTVIWAATPPEPAHWLKTHRATR